MVPTASLAHPESASSLRPGGAPAGKPSSTSIHADGVGLVFPNGFVGLKETSLHIEAGEFCTLLGASGSGKTTLLRVIAGLLEPTSGRVMLGGQDVTNMPVQSRNIGFVFQNYALFPHMSVAENIAYPLKVHKWSSEARTARTREVLELIELSHVADRAVGDLSGGQQQRIAIGRALSYRPSLLLLDEPMGALDRRLRQQLGRQLREIQQNAGVTAVYVTHDQEEAFILSDRIAIMNKGEILQYAAPEELYFQPNSRYVATFLGEANLFEVTGLTATDTGTMRATTGFGRFPFRDDSINDTAAGQKSLVVRPEEIKLVTGPGPIVDMVDPIPVTIKKELFLGSRCLLTLGAPGEQDVLVECVKAEIPAPGADVFMTWREDSAVLVNH